MKHAVLPVPQWRRKARAAGVGLPEIQRTAAVGRQVITWPTEDDVLGESVHSWLDDAVLRYPVMTPEARARAALIDAGASKVDDVARRDCVERAMAALAAVPVSVRKSLIAAHWEGEMDVSLVEQFQSLGAYCGNLIRNDWLTSLFHCTVAREDCAQEETGRRTRAAIRALANSCASDSMQSAAAWLYERVAFAREAKFGPAFAFLRELHAAGLGDDGLSSVASEHVRTGFGHRRRFDDNWVEAHAALQAQVTEKLMRRVIAKQPRLSAPVLRRARCV